MYLRNKLFYRYNGYKVKIYAPQTCEINQTPTPSPIFDIFSDYESECIIRTFKQFKISLLRGVFVK